MTQLTDSELINRYQAEWPEFLNGCDGYEDAIQALRSYHADRMMEQTVDKIVGSPKETCLGCGCVFSNSPSQMGAPKQRWTFKTEGQVPNRRVVGHYCKECSDERDEVRDA